MADDVTQRPYRSNDSIARTAPAKPGAPSGSDPLAELARLIGQNDPFSEYGRAAAAPQASPVASAALQAPLPDTQAFAPPNFPPPNFGRPSFGGTPVAAGSEPYQVASDPHGYPAAAQDGGYEDDGYHSDKRHLGGEEDDYYEDVAPSRRRMSVMVIAGIFALAVIGTAGAFGYRALFGSSGTSTPPVIKADSAPSKIVPASNRDTSPNKLITDRVNDRTQTERLVSREEQPIDIKDRSAGAAFPPPAQDQANVAAPAPGSGIVSPDAKRVRTIAIHPDQSVVADAMPVSTSQAAPVTPAQPRAITTPPARPAAAPPAPVQQQAPPPPRVAANAPPADAQPEAATPAPKRPTAARVPPAVAQHQAAAPANAPLSLNPNAPARAPQPAAAPVRTAAVPAQTAPAPASGGGSYAVQVSSQRSEAEAQAAFRSLQGKFPDQLGNKQPLIHKVDLGAKGIYYRAMVGPFATGSEASELCSSLKAAGGQCLIQRN